MLLFCALLPTINTGLTPFLRILIGSLRYFLCCDWSVGKVPRPISYFASEPLIMTITFTLFIRLKFLRKLGNHVLCVLLTSRLVIARLNPRSSVIYSDEYRHGYWESVRFVLNQLVISST